MGIVQCVIKHTENITPMPCGVDPAQGRVTGRKFTVRRLYKKAGSNHTMSCEVNACPWGCMIGVKFQTCTLQAKTKICENRETPST